MWLVADVGGTKTELGLYDVEKQEVVVRQRYENNAYENIKAILSVFFILAKCTPSSIKQALFAVAGPVQKNEQGVSFVQLTNRSWKIEQPFLQSLFPNAQVQILNDFYVVTAACVTWAEQLAQGYACSSVVSLTSNDKPLFPSIVVSIGAGTGLGQAFALPTKNLDMQIVSTEGGHVDFAPRTEVEIELLSFIQEHKEGYASYGHILSGAGIELLYSFFVHRSLQKHVPSGGITNTLSAADISARALLGEDLLCQQTLECFAQIYASYASNVAVQLFPQGGLFLAGGIAPKILPFLQTEAFLHRFLDRKPFREICEKIPIYIVTDPHATLWGAISLIALNK